MNDVLAKGQVGYEQPSAGALGALDGKALRCGVLPQLIGGSADLAPSNKTNMKDAGDFDKVTILKPYSFVLVDEEKETVAELLLIDDDTILVNDELLKGLDKELDDFLKDLLEK